ncbi:helix-turn-helix domain-containing protein [Acetomicrobium sp. S15 = DSM 107314]|uniref:helix-turn-helix domain-containing protein n=1 Tax=Acetomicrobium sp. S15 = DSM 107314 TaxID=2529858 RepID=UPI00406CAD2B
MVACGTKGVKAVSETVEILDSRDFWFCFLDIAVMTDETISVYDMAIYAALCSFASTRGRTCYPSVKALMKRAGCSYRTVHRSLRTLEDKGYIQHQYRGEKGQTSIYILKGGVSQGHGGVPHRHTRCATQTHRTIAIEL